MTDGHRSFWSSVPGLITGLAGLLTGVVGLGTLAVQQGIIGKDSSNPTTTVAGAGGVGSGPPTTEAGSLTVSPVTLEFQPTDAKEKSVTVRNTSATASITLSQPKLTGDDAGRFVASFGSCTSAPLPPNLSCTVKVTFTPSGALRRYSATMQLQAGGAPAGAEVRISATTLL